MAHFSRTIFSAFLFVLFPVAVSAANASNSSVGNPEIINQIEIVKGTLADLNSKLDMIVMQLNDQGDEIDMLIDKANTVERDIKIESTLCFSANHANSFRAKVEGEIGVGWDLGIIAEIKLKPSFSLVETKLGLGSKICIKVPLHKVASHPLHEFENTAAFDQLIALIVSPSQALIPAMGTLYSAIVPPIIPIPASSGLTATAHSPGLSGSFLGSAMQATANIVQAATGTDIINGTTGPANPGMLLRPDQLLAPIVSGPYQGFVNEIPNIFADMAANPCGFLTGAGLPLLGVNTVPVCQDVGVIINFVLDIIDPFYILDPFRLVH